MDLPALLPSGENFVLLVRNHVENIRRLRTAMAATLDPDVLVRFGNTLCNLQVRYMEQFWRCRWTLQERPYMKRRCQHARKPIGSSSWNRLALRKNGRKR